MTTTLAKVRAHLRIHFAEADIDRERDAASVTFLGTEPFGVLRFGPGTGGVDVLAPSWPAAQPG